MSTMEMWRGAMRPYAGDVLCMDDVQVYEQWLAEVHDGKCPFCGQPVVVREATVCANPACLFNTVTYSVLMKSNRPS
jgi:hypothetical protein